MNKTQHPTGEEQTQFRISSFRGIEVGLAHSASTASKPEVVAWMIEFDDKEENVVTIDPREVEAWRVQHDNPYEAIPLCRLDAVPSIQEQEQHYDDYAVDCFAVMMKEKLAKKRTEGRDGWSDPTRCSVEYLNKLLLEHVEKGDPVDVANFCMMLRHYDAKIDTAPPTQALALPELTQELSDAQLRDMWNVARKNGTAAWLADRSHRNQHLWRLSSFASEVARSLLAGKNL